MELDTSYVTVKRISKLSNQVSNRNLNASYVTVKHGCLCSRRKFDTI